MNPTPTPAALEELFKQIADNACYAGEQIGDERVVLLAVVQKKFRKYGLAQPAPEAEVFRSGWLASCDPIEPTPAQAPGDERRVDEARELVAREYEKEGFRNIAKGIRDREPWPSFSAEYMLRAITAALSAKPAQATPPAADAGGLGAKEGERAAYVSGYAAGGRDWWDNPTRPELEAMKRMAAHKFESSYELPSADAGAVAGWVVSSEDGSIGNVIAPEGWSTKQSILDKFASDPWVKCGKAKIIPLYTRPGPSGTEGRE